MNKHYGFTLIELLIVVAIIAILAAIAIPNFLQAQTRAKVSRVQADLQTVATALEAYATDNNNYPFVTGSGLVNDEERLALLTTPVSYITRVPQDGFNAGVGAISQQVYLYSDRGQMLIQDARNPGHYFNPLPGVEERVTDQDCVWMVTSIGPDGVLDTSFPMVANDFIIQYDPSNGTVSNGDVFRYCQ